LKGFEIVGGPSQRLSAQVGEFCTVVPTTPRNLGPFGLRCIGMTMARSSSVPASPPMLAITFGDHVENLCGLWSPPISTLRIT
jgi:hypothetical protein